MDETITRHRLHMAYPRMDTWQAECSCGWHGEVFSADQLHSDDDAHTAAVEDGEDHWAYA